MSKEVATTFLFSHQAVAAAGSVIGDATLIGTKAPALIHATGADATKGVRLPPAVAGKQYTIKNSDAANAVLKVWPYSASEAINAIAAGSALSMAAKTSAVFSCVANGTWYTTPLLPS